MCQKVMTENNCRAMDVSVFKQGKQVFSFKEGIKNSKQKIDKESMFSIGSISKIFATVSIMILVEEGKLSLDTPVYKILPQFKMKDKNYQKITVKMLLNHSSGLPSIAKMGKYTNVANRQFLRETIELYHDLYLNHIPGKISCYCNDAYSLVELIVEQIAQTSYANFVYQKICIPCELEDTDFQVHDIRKERIVLAENEFGHDYPQEFVNGIASGGVVSTAENISKFMDNLIHGKLISEESLLLMGKLQMASPYGFDYDSNDRHGLGWDEVEIEPFCSLRQKAWLKNGSTFGFNSSVIVLYDAEIVVAVLLCDENIKAETIAKKLAYLYLEEPQYKGRTLNPVEMATEITGLYGGNNKIYRVNSSASKDIEIKNKEGYISYVDSGLCPYKNPKFKFALCGKKTFLLVEYDDEAFEGIRQRRMLAQKLQMNYTGNNWENLNGQKYICIRESIDCRMFKIEPIILSIEIEKGYSDTLLYPHPLRILNDRIAVPFIDVIGNEGKEMATLERVGMDALQLGHRAYINLNTVTKLTNKEIYFRNPEIEWYRIEDEIDTLRFDGRVRCVIINDQEDVIFDSDLCTRLPEKSKGCYIGFLGENGAKATISVMEEQ